MVRSFTNQKNANTFLEKLRNGKIIINHNGHLPIGGEELLLRKIIGDSIRFEIFRDFPNSPFKSYIYETEAKCKLCGSDYKYIINEGEITTYNFEEKDISSCYYNLSKDIEYGFRVQADKKFLISEANYIMNFPLYLNDDNVKEYFHFIYMNSHSKIGYSTVNNPCQLFVLRSNISGEVYYVLGGDVSLDYKVNDFYDVVNFINSPKFNTEEFSLEGSMAIKNHFMIYPQKIGDKNLEVKDYYISVTNNKSMSFNFINNYHNPSYDFKLENLGGLKVAFRMEKV